MKGKKISQTRSRAMRQSWIRRRETGTANLRKAKNGELAPGTVYVNDGVLAGASTNHVTAAVELARALLAVCDGNLTTATTLLAAAVATTEGGK